MGKNIDSILGTNFGGAADIPKGKKAGVLLDGGQILEGEITDADLKVISSVLAGIKPQTP